MKKIKIKKGNKGFTLIELLVAIALMISILAIAIVSFIGISDRKKNEAWKSVKGQIETAAEQFFKSNEYLFEGLNEESKIEGSISVGKLVSNDYLNIVTDPRTGKAVSSCAIVNITKNGNVITADFDEESETSDSNEACDTDNSYTLRESGAPDLNVTVACEFPGDNGWCKGKDGSGHATVTPEIDDTVVKLTYCSKKGSNDCDPENEVKDPREENVITHEDETDFTSYCYAATNSKGNTAKLCRTVKLDKSLPTFTLNSYEKDIADDISSSTDKSILGKYTGGNWSRKWAYTEVTNVNDSVSGIADGYPRYTTTGTTSKSTNVKGYHRNVNAQGTSTVTYEVCDKAGNCAENQSVTVKLDRTAPTFTLKSYTKTSSANVTSEKGMSSYTGGTWSNKWVFIKVAEVSDGNNGSGVASGYPRYTATGATTDETNKVGNYKNVNGEGTSAVTYEVCDNAGNCADKQSVTVKLDRTAPIGTIAVSSVNSDYNSNVVNVSLNASDKKGSGVKTVRYTDKAGSKDYTIGKSEWSSTLNSRTLFSSLNKSVQSDNIKMVITDNAGNQSTVTGSYETYALCSKTKSNGTQSGNWSACSKTCGGGTQTRTVSDKLVDAMTNQSCGTGNSKTTSQACNTQSCTLNCPVVTISGYEKAKLDSNDIWWYKGKDIKLNHDGDANYWTWYKDSYSTGKTSTSLSLGTSSEGSHSYKLVGKNGENCISQDFHIDNTAPTCTVTISGTAGDNGWWKGTNYKVNVKNNETGKVSTETKTSNINESLTYKVEDAVGNEGSCSIHVSFENENTIYLGINDENKLKTTTTDDGKCKKYSKASITQKNSFNGGGTTYYKYTSIDEAQNNCSGSAITMYRDTTTPSNNITNFKTFSGMAEWQGKGYIIKSGGTKITCNTEFKAGSCLSQGHTYLDGYYRIKTVAGNFTNEIQFIASYNKAY